MCGIYPSTIVLLKGAISSAYHLYMMPAPFVVVTITTVVYLAQMNNLEFQITSTFLLLFFFLKIQLSPQPSLCIFTASFAPLCNTSLSAFVYF